MSALSQNVASSFVYAVPSHIVPSLKFALDRVDPEELASLPTPGNQSPYARTVLVDTPELMVVATRWRAGARSELLTTPQSASVIRVVSGTIEEERYVSRNGEYEHDVKLLAQNDESHLQAGSLYQLRALEEAITIHAYSPRPDNARSEPTQQERYRLADARRNSKAFEKPARIEFPQWGVKSSRHDKTVEKLAKELAPRWGKYESEADEDGTHRLSYRVLEEIRSSGILAAPIPRYWGGLTASLTETARAVATIANHAPAAALALVMPLANAATTRISLSAVPRDQAQTLRENQRWIAEQVTRGRILAGANSHPDEGAHLSQTKTVASRGIDGNYYLTGQKTLATMSPDADYYFCEARTAVDVHTPTGIETVIRIEGYFVHRDAPGVTIDANWDAASRLPASNFGLNLEYAPAERIYAYPGAVESANALHWSTLLFSAALLGIGQAALAEGLRNAGHSPWARAKLAEHALALDAAAGYLEATCEAEAWPMPKELLNRTERVKAFVTQTVVQIASQVAVIFGSQSTSGHPPLPSTMDIIMNQLVA